MYYMFGTSAFVYKKLVWTNKFALLANTSCTSRAVNGPKETSGNKSVYKKRIPCRLV